MNTDAEYLANKEHLDKRFQRLPRRRRPQVQRNVAETLLMQYSEWLDCERVEISSKNDCRTHADPVGAFLVSRDVNASPNVVG